MLTLYTMYSIFRLWDLIRPTMKGYSKVNEKYNIARLFLVLKHSNKCKSSVKAIIVHCSVWSPQFYLSNCRMTPVNLEFMNIIDLIAESLCWTPILR